MGRKKSRVLHKGYDTGAWRGGRGRHGICKRRGQARRWPVSAVAVMLGRRQRLRDMIMTSQPRRDMQSEAKAVKLKVQGSSWRRRRGGGGGGVKGGRADGPSEPTDRRCVPRGWQIRHAIGGIKSPYVSPGIVACCGCVCRVSSALKGKAFREGRRRFSKSIRLERSRAFCGGARRPPEGEMSPRGIHNAGVPAARGPISDHPATTRWGGRGVFVEKLWLFFLSFPTSMLTGPFLA